MLLVETLGQEDPWDLSTYFSQVGVNLHVSQNENFKETMAHNYSNGRSPEHRLNQWPVKVRSKGALLRCWWDGRWRPRVESPFLGFL